MTRHSEAIALNGAPSQYARWLRALDAGYARVDGRSLTELLDFAPRFGELVHFYNLRDEPEGDWVGFFLADPTMILASIQAMDLETLEREYSRIEQRTAAARSADRKHGLLTDLFRLIHGLGRRVDLWLRGLVSGSTSPLAERLRREIAAEIEDRLGEAMRRLKAYDQGAGSPETLGRAIGLDFSPFGAPWKLRPVPPDGSIYGGDGKTRRIDRALRALRGIFRSVTAGVAGLQSVTEGDVPSRLGLGDERPQLALYIAFVELFRTARDTVNTISSRYIRFYYHDVLREGYRGAVPDRVFLTFTLALEEGVRSTVVPRGTLFPAGEDANGNEILFALERDLAVSAAQIAAVRTLRVVNGPLYTPVSSVAAAERGPEAPTDSEPTVRRILSSVVSTEAEAGAGWATFGTATVGTTETEVTEPAALGFALASSELLLTGGERVVTLTVEYPRSFYEAVLEPRLDGLAAATGLDPTRIWTIVLEEAFRLYFSTATGWFAYEGDYSVKVPPVHGNPELSPWFSLEMSLSPSAPPVQGYGPDNEEEGTEDEGEAAAPVTENPEIVATNPAPGAPTLKAYLRQKPVVLAGGRGRVEVYPLSLLNGLKVLGFDLVTDVCDLPAETLENTDGEIEPDSPFTVFGGVPTVGSYLQISHSEIFTKVPETLSVAIRWFDLPPNDTGFKGWYRDYVLNLDGEPQEDLFDNRVFMGAFSLRNPGAWWLQAADTEYRDCEDSPPEPITAYLFRTENACDDPEPKCDVKLCPTSGFAFQGCSTSSDLPAYYDPAESALRLTLTAPPYAFGNDLYAQNVLRAVIDVLPDPEACQAQCEGECGPLSQAADGLADCLTRCAEVPEEDYAACLQKCVRRCQDILLAGAFLCLLRCLIEKRESLDAEVFSRLEARVQASREKAPTERAKILRQALDELSAWADTAGRDRGVCVSRCRRFLDGYFCISDCLSECCTYGNGGKLECDQECLTQCLTFCQVGLKDAYGECVEECLEECTKEEESELKYPNEPYLPQAEAVSLGYTARTSPATFFHLLPFGGYRRSTVGSGAGASLLPVFGHPGYLYLGFSELIPPRILTLLFQMTTAEDPLQEADLPPVEWQVLAGDTWRTLEPSQILLDSTWGLENTGILELSLPRYDADDHTVAPTGLQWLRASVAEDPNRFPHTLAITPQAGTAAWTADDEAPEEQLGEHLDQPVPAGTITTSVQNLADIETIDQPLASFGGRPPEDRRGFQIRLGERLRHKDRAVLDWDYERLVLERFPAIWKVQTLPARDVERGDAPGKVLVVVVPGPNLGEAMDPTVPRAPGEVLRRIQTYLEDRASPFVELRVVNPVYVRITVTAEVEFRGEGESGGSVGRLDDDLVAYLSPWFYDAARAAKGGRYVSQADIAEFVRTRPYIQRLVSIAFDYAPKREGLDWYFLTSAREHRITEVLSHNGSTNPPCTKEVANV